MTSYSSACSLLQQTEQRNRQYHNAGGFAQFRLQHDVGPVESSRQYDEDGNWQKAYAVIVCGSCLFHKISRLVIILLQHYLLL